MARFLVEDLMFIRIIHDPCVFVRFSENSNRTKLECIICLYVDDLEIGGNSKEIVDLIKLKSKVRFGNITDMGQLTFILV